MLTITCRYSWPLLDLVSGVPPLRRSRRGQRISGLADGYPITLNQQEQALHLLASLAYAE